MKATFDHSVNVLVKAYLDGTLLHGNCYTCAVGNLVADGLKCGFVQGGAKGNLRWDNNMPYPGDDSRINLVGWGAVFSTDRYGSSWDNRGGRKVQRINTNNLEAPLAKQQIESTGYHWTDLARIEKAFESVDKRKKDRMFNGLMAVVDVLAEIHNIDLTAKESAKKLFVKP